MKKNMEKLISASISIIKIIKVCFGVFLIIILLQFVLAFLHGKGFIEINSTTEKKYTNEVAKVEVFIEVPKVEVSIRNETAKAEELEVFIMLKENNEAKIIAVILWILLNLMLYDRD